MKIIVISLIDANQRRAQIKSQLSAHNLPFSWLDAVDGRKWSDDELAQFIDKKALYKNLSHKPVAGSVGCHLSHMKAYETSASFFASLLGLTLKAINTAFDALANVTSVSVTIPISAKIILGLTSSCLI